MHWPPTNQWTDALQPYYKGCETGDSIGLYSVSECTKKLLMNLSKSYIVFVHVNNP